MRIAVYARQSTDRTGQELGVERQVEACREYAYDRRWQVVAEYVDNGISASRFSDKERPQFERLLAQAKAGNIDGIVVWAVDRLYRRLTDLERLVGELGHIPVHSVTAGRIDLASSDGRLQARLLASVAAHESDRKSERIKLAKQQARAQGKWLGRAPRGYLMVDGELVPDPKWADRVRDGFQRVLDGDSLNHVARDWGVYASAVRKLLQSPAIAGLTSELQPGTWPALVPEAEWWRMKALLEDRSRPDRMSPKKGNPETLLGGILRCEHGRALKRVVDTYRINSVPCGCSISIEQQLADKHITDLVLAELAKPEVREAFIVPAEGPDFRRLDELKGRRAAVASMLADGLLQESDARAQLERLKTEIDGLSTVTRPNIDLTGIDGYPAVVWGNLNPRQRRAVIRYVLGDITVRPGRLPLRDRLTPSR